MSDSSPTLPAPPPVPRTFWEYLRSFGPGLVVVLTWLGAGDVVDMGVAGGSYGYALMWVLVVALVIRYLFVSLIAKYQLCNERGEGVLDGLASFQWWYAPLLLSAAFVMGHLYCAYMTVGVGEICRNVFGWGQVWQWAIACNLSALLLVFQPVYGRVEVLFKFLLALLAISFLGCALWVGPDPADIAQGLFRIEVPDQRGDFSPWLVGLAMIGAIGGSLMNLVYPYFLDAKGWKGPRYRRVQQYDFLLGVVVMILLNLSVWVLGAELMHPMGRTIENIEDLAALLGDVLGERGRVLFYLGVFAAVYTSIVGHALGLACLGSHAWLRWKTGPGPLPFDFRTLTLYRVLVVWCLVTPLVWTIPGMPGFVRLTLLANGAQVVFLPLIAGGLWWITAHKKYIGERYRNNAFENLLMAALFALALYGAWKSVGTTYVEVRKLINPAAEAGQ